MFLTVPPPLPGDVCIEVLWELIHSDVINESERDNLVDNLVPWCRQHHIAPPIMDRL
jgi:hypothetical protein